MWLAASGKASDPATSTAQARTKVRAGRAAHRVSTTARTVPQNVQRTVPKAKFAAVNGWAAAAPGSPATMGIGSAARRPARVGPGGTLVPLTEQDRGRWDRDRIAEGLALVADALTRTALGPYQLQAAVAAVHAEAADPESTDWAQILGLYALLESIAPNPVVTLNRAVALAMVRGPAAGLRLLESLDSDRRIAGHHRLPAVRGHLYELAGDRDAARTAYLAAARRTTSLPERRYLERRAAALSGPG